MSRPADRAMSLVGASLLTEQQLAAEFGLATATLRDWRVLGRGPAFCKLGRSVRYRRADIEAWLAAQVRHSTSDSGAAAPRSVA